MPRRKAGARQPCGKLRPVDPRKAAWEARERVLGLPAEVARSELAGALYGRLRAAGELTEPQHEACRRYEAMWIEYAPTLCPPSGHRSICGPIEPKGHDGRDTSDRDAEIGERWRKVVDAMGGPRSLTAAAVHRLVVQDEGAGYTLVNARIGLNSLVRYWSL